MILLATLTALLLGALGLSRLSGDGDEGPRALPGQLAGDPGPIHVHGLGINPSDSSLFIATHTGMWRVDADETKAERVTDRSQDTMGFTVVGADRFLGSGHPDPREARAKNLPPLLGLIESGDAGRSWRPISLLGQADFHVLRSLGKRVYGYDASNDRLLVSPNAGRTWAERPRPAPLVDVAPDPRNPQQLVATSEQGFHRSTDGGRSWRRQGNVSGLLAWPARSSLFLVDGGGQVLVSGDAGRHWKPLGAIGAQPAAILGISATELYAALHDGTIKRSLDAGATWAVRSTP